MPKLSVVAVEGPVVTRSTLHSIHQHADRLRPIGAACNMVVHFKQGDKVACGVKDAKATSNNPARTSCHRCIDTLTFDGTISGGLKYK